MKLKKPCINLFNLITQFNNLFLIQISSNFYKNLSKNTRDVVISHFIKQKLFTDEISTSVHMFIDPTEPLIEHSIIWWRQGVIAVQVLHKAVPVEGNQRLKKKCITVLL